MKKYRVNIILLILVSILIMFLVLKDDFNQIIDYLFSVNLLWILVAVFFMLLNIMFQSLSIHGFIKGVKKNYRFIDTYLLMLSALFFNAITPFSSGGQPFQMYMLKKQGVKLTESGNVFLQNFFSFQLALTLMGTFSIVMNSIFEILPKDNLLKKIVLIGYVANVLVLVILFLLANAKKTNTHVFNKILDFVFGFKFIKNREKLREQASEKVDEFYKSSIYFKRNKIILFKSVLYNVLSLVSLYIIPVFIFLSVDKYDSLTFFDSIVCAGYTYLIGSFVPIPGGTGGLEYAFVEFFQSFSIGATLSAIMILWRFVTYYFGMIIGAVSLLFLKKEVK